MAVFLTFWTWAYTYKADNWKFWLNGVLTVLSLGFWLLVAWPWAIIDAVRRPEEWYQSFPNGDMLQQQQGIQQAENLQAALQQPAQPPAAPALATEQVSDLLPTEPTPPEAPQA